MKYYTFQRELNNFDDILTDVAIKKHIKTKLKWKNHLMIGLDEKTGESVFGYIVLKYGEDIVNLIKDFTPVPNVDYKPMKLIYEAERNR